MLTSHISLMYPMMHSARIAEFDRAQYSSIATTMVDSCLCRPRKLTNQSVCQSINNSACITFEHRELNSLVFFTKIDKHLTYLLQLFYLRSGLQSGKDVYAFDFDLVLHREKTVCCSYIRVQKLFLTTRSSWKSVHATRN